MRKRAGRTISLGVALAAPLLSAALAFPAVASADPSPTVSGDCESTLQNGKKGTGLALDAGAPLNAPNRLTVGLDSKAKQTDGNDTLFTLPVGDTVRTLGVGEVPAVGDTAAKDTCPMVQAAANGVGNATQKLVGGLPGTPTPSPQPTPGPPNPTPRPPSPAPGPGGPDQPVPGGDTLGPVISVGGLSGLDAVSGIFSGAAMLPASFVQAPLVTQVVPGQLPQDQVPTVDAKRSGTAEALPAANPPARLPLLIAVLALALVAAALVRAWLRRTPA
ncbi:hypothetical protein CU254_38970 [Amycolatopsis sp. AA4]|uniref:hypothetical protein n=1 Tax=Actinomycetes TaxID=1760 RepID=UPI0001B56BDE|nr:MULTISPECIES: hypothetical protein [Actinomycetes]ATY15709.1 hypothetical protein CU254_38970 [Amycolatopsis sp. AA4]EFL12006.1 predicted protein [Streptomyces sp. AA4]